MNVIAGGISKELDGKLFYKYTSAEAVKNILATTKLRWSSPLTFNDPLDMSKELRVNFTEQQLSDQLNEEVAKLVAGGMPAEFVRNPKLKTLLAHISPMSKKRRLAIAAEQRRESPKITKTNIFEFARIRDTWRSMVPTFRILCLSESREILPMWNLYADSYRGVVLEFTAVAAVDSPLLCARPVIYQDTPPAIADIRAWTKCMLGIGKITYQDLFRELEYIKTTSWKPEREWRVVNFADDGDTGLYSHWGFFPEELVSVTLGPQSNSEIRKELEGLLVGKLSHVQIYQAVIDPTIGSMRFNRF